MKIKKALFDGETMRLMALAVLVKPMALVSQMLVARFFGASAQLDAFNFSLFLVTFLGWTVSRVFSTVIIPQITRMRKTMTHVELSSYQNALICLFNIPVVFLSLLFLVWGNVVIDIIGANLPVETKEYAYKIIRVMSIPGILFALVKLNTPFLNLNKLFRIPAAFGPVHSTSLLISVWVLHGSIGIWALPAGWAISYSIQIIILQYSLWKKKILTFEKPAIPQGGVAALWSLSWMVLISQTLLMTNTFVDKWFASGLPVGSISYINYALIIVNFGQQIFSMSLVVVMFTKMSEYFAAEDFQGCDRYIHNNLVKVTHLVVPICVGLFAVSPEIVHVLFERGAFSSADARQTSATLSLYLLGLPAIVLNGIIARVFHSLQKLKQRIWLSLQYIGTNILGNFLLVKIYGTVGLAFSSTTAINLHLLLSLLIMRSFSGGLGAGRYARVIITAYLLAGISYFIFWFMGIEAWANGLWEGDGFWVTVFLAAVKFGFIVAMYGLQIMVLFKMRSQRR